MSASSTKQLKRSFNRKVILIFSAIVLDAVATVFLMCMGWGEVNPLMNWVAKVGGPCFMGITKIVWSLLLMCVLVRREEFKRFINYLIIAYFLFYTVGFWAQFVWEGIKIWTR